MKRDIFIISFLLVLFIAALNELAVNYFFYWRIWWFDILMHFLGGLWVGLSALWLYVFSDYFKNPRRDAEFIFVLSVSSVAVVGIGWEVFEFLIESNYSSGYIEDTILDLIMDLIGALVAGTIVFKTNKKRIQNIL
ncbi:hypothetical protein A3I18_02375 [Candidatus Campbellbacteria bacterium RIFCSPLOWO2_02_FULL_35_11]|uniref:VanZ-like domain-containing protein n=2 Tax=Candidatus Campbelliibacteriota TaxID=1752727 RepID=A0A1F5EPY3_9BACT|nr:MAG: hypothetical protein A3E89_00275 [Candidatus Campbellbacteria bacterium RIFCSPHIGHO2_12_FULL_35_10]OGD69714.1 MAG: hypothetical protein A3I18_02375 [Candidatus Campbellbacteria bacterium RIFCSPLOWO2_02_FULL_35_11]